MGRKELWFKTYVCSSIGAKVEEELKKIYVIGVAEKKGRRTYLKEGKVDDERSCA